MAGDFTPYATGRTWFGQKPAHVDDPLDQERLQSYLLYEQMYWNAPEIFKVTMRGTNSMPIYVPSARTIVDTSNRYTAPGFALNITDKVPGATPSNDVLAARLAMQDFFKRERFNAKFLGAKRYCQIQGDWIWHITADATKPIGTRISIVSLDPGMYFPILNPDDQEDIIGVHLASVVQEGNDSRVHRLTYREVRTADSKTITVEEGIFELGNWRSDEAEPVRVIRPVSTLPPEITQIPVYHTKNFEEPGNPFGSSEIRGLEVVMAAVNQTVSDEELALALDGIGQYWTDAPHPVDPQTKKQTAWVMGPGTVNHVPAGNVFGRLAGVGSVTPYGDHYNRLWESMKQASASPDIAIGKIDVKVASSGIALALEMQPILAKAGEKDTLIQATHDQMFFDLLTMWYPAYEETSFGDGTLNIDTMVGDKLPVDRAERFQELNDMLDRKVIDTEYYRTEAAKLGYVFPQDMSARVEKEQKTLAPQLAPDPFANRVQQDLNGGPGNGPTGA